MDFFCQVTDNYLLNKHNKISIYRCALKKKKRSSTAYIYVKLRQIKAPNLVKIIITLWFFLPLYYLFRRPTIKMYSSVSCIWWLGAVHNLTFWLVLTEILPSPFSVCHVVKCHILERKYKQLCGP